MKEIKIFKGNKNQFYIFCGARFVCSCHAEKNAQRIVDVLKDDEKERLEYEEKMLEEANGSVKITKLITKL